MIKTEQNKPANRIVPMGPHQDYPRVMYKGADDQPVKVKDEEDEAKAKANGYFRTPQSPADAEKESASKAKSAKPPKA